jgi:hypothetical protein
MKHKFFIVLSLIIALILLGCEKGMDNSDTGILSIKLTDSPFPINLVEKATVKINKIEIRGDQPESEGNPFLVLSEEEFTYNLLELQNGITADLVEVKVPVGDYNLVRLYVDSAGIKLKDQTDYNLKVPSGEQTGIKIFMEPAITVVGGLTTELVLDFDVSQSFVVQGNPYTPAGIKGFIFKPVIRAANESTTGSITGKIIDNTNNTSPVALAEAQVWIETDETDDNNYSTFSDENGLYKLSFIPEGIYTINASKKTTEVEYDTVSVENVEVVAGNNTQLDDIMLTRIE